MLNCCRIYVFAGDPFRATGLPQIPTSHHQTVWREFTQTSLKHGSFQAPKKVAAAVTFHRKTGKMRPIVKAHKHGVVRYQHVNRSVHAQTAIPANSRTVAVIDFQCYIDKIWGSKRMLGSTGHELISYLYEKTSLRAEHG